MELKDWLEKDISEIYVYVGQETEKISGIRQLSGFEKREEIFKVKKTGEQAKQLYKEKAEKFIGLNIKKLRKIICPRYSKNTKNLDDASAIVTAISSLLGVSAPIACAILAIMIKRGLDHLCS